MKREVLFLAFPSRLRCVELFLPALAPSGSEDNDLIVQPRRAVGQVERRLLGQLLGIVGPGSAPEDDQLARANDVQLKNPAAQPALDVALDPIGEATWVPTLPKAWSHLGVVRRHSPLHHREARSRLIHPHRRRSHVMVGVPSSGPSDGILDGGSPEEDHQRAYFPHISFAISLNFGWSVWGFRSHRRPT